MVYKYKVLINDVDVEGKVSFKYGMTDNVRIALRSNGATINFTLGREYSEFSEKTYLIRLIKEAIYRVAIIYTLKYERVLRIKNIKIILNDNDISQKNIHLKDYFLLESLNNNLKFRTIPKEYKSDKFFINLLSFKKTDVLCFEEKISQKLAVVYAYLISKCKENVYERFLFSWIAFNGFYNYIYPGKNKDNDANKLCYFIKKYVGVDSMIGREQRNKIGKMIRQEIKKFSLGITEDTLENGSHKELRIYIEEKLKNENVNLKPYWFLLVHFTYYLRCSLFHANESIPLYGFQDDDDAKTLAIASELLENFLDKNISAIISGAKK